MTYFLASPCPASLPSWSSFWQPQNQTSWCQSSFGTMVPKGSCLLRWVGASPFRDQLEKILIWQEEITAEPPAALSSCLVGDKLTTPQAYASQGLTVLFFFLKANAARAAWFTVMEWLSKWHRFHMSALACLISELSHSKWLLRRFSIMRGQWVAQFEACAATVSVLLIWVTLPGSKVERPPAYAKLRRQTRNKHGLL